jgi:PBSX family phage terminase large subunit
MLELIKRKNIKITVWRNTKVTCRATVMEDFQNIIMFDETISKKFKENKQNGTFTYIPTGSRIVFEGADQIGKVLGSQQDISFFNEVTEFSKEVYLQITQRTSDRVICDYNPSKDFWLEGYRHDKESKFIRTTFKDNKFCPPAIVKQLLSYEPWEPGSYEVRDTEVFYKGQPVTPQNQPPVHKDNWKKGTASVYMWLV